MKVKEFMKSTKNTSAPNISVNQDENIDNAAILMKNNKLDQIMVVNDSDKVVGKITRKSIVEASDDINEDFFID